MKIPVKIDPCPIVEAIVELRFNSVLPDDAVFGVIYNEFSEQYGKVEKLPILQLPEAVRSKDPNLLYQPHYKLFKDDFIMQIGPRVFSFANVNEYIGWKQFYGELISIFKRLAGLNVMTAIGRIGLRYINIFSDKNIFEESMLKVLLSEDDLYNHQINLTITVPNNEFISRLVMVNKASVDLAVQNKTVEGSVIDIDVGLEKIMTFENIEETIEKAHTEEKKLFFGLLKPDYLKTLNPEY